MPNNHHRVNTLFPPQHIIAAMLRGEEVANTTFSAQVDKLYMFLSIDPYRVIDSSRGPWPFAGTPPINRDQQNFAFGVINNVLSAQLGSNHLIPIDPFSQAGKDEAIRLRGALDRRFPSIPVTSKVKAFISRVEYTLPPMFPGTALDIYSRTIAPECAPDRSAHAPRTTGPSPGNTR